MYTFRCGSLSARLWVAAAAETLREPAGQSVEVCLEFDEKQRIS